MKEIILIIISTFIVGLVGLSGVLLLIFGEKNIKRIIMLLVSFATGSILGGAIFHFIPESIEQISYKTTIIITLIGLLVSLIFERILFWHHCHKEKCAHPSGYLLLYGNAIHNFLDGIIIASSFLVSKKIGIITSFLIISHEIPQEIGNFAVLIHKKFKKSEALLYNFIAQLTALIGGILGYFFIGVKEKAMYLLPFAAGSFLYISLNDLFPEMLKEKNERIKNLIFFTLGLLLLLSLKTLLK